MKKFLILLFSLSTTLIFAQQVVQAEYFFDTDPGYGNGQSISINTAEEIAIDDYFDVSELNPGFHTFNIRVKDENNNWSPVLIKGFYMNQNMGEAIPIDYIEYFYDDDPGYGNGIPYSDFSASTNLDESFFSDVSGLSEGMHEFNIRLRNELNQWSQTYSQNFELLNCDLEISGMVTHQDQTVVDDAEIILFQYFGEGAAIGVDTLQLTDGNYTFTNVCPMSEYFLKVIPESTTAYPPCYYGNTIYWQDATTIVTEQSSVSGVDIVVFDFPDLSPGTSSISGHIFYADSRGEPVKNIDVVLEYDAPADKNGFEAVAYDRSNDYGEWILENLPNGDYRIKVEIPGLEMDTTYYVNIANEGSVVENLDFYVDMNTGIYIDYFGIDEFQLADELEIFPNPAIHQNIWIRSLNNSVKIEEIIIYNYLGQELNQTQVNNQETKIENASWSKGFYLLKIKTNKGVLTQKIIVQ